MHALLDLAADGAANDEQESGPGFLDCRGQWQSLHSADEDDQC